ncbi:MAG: hypothetical protein ACI901_001320, partial [Octadecabacter sp.]
AITSDRAANVCNISSAAGQLEQPCEVKSSKTTGPSAITGVTIKKHEAQMEKTVTKVWRIKNPVVSDFL